MRLLILVVAISAAATVAGSAMRAESVPERSVEPTVTPPDTASSAEAPFGLRWLAPKQQVEEMGIVFKDPMPTTEFGSSYVVSKLPKELADLEYAVLSFGYDDHLVRITAIGEGFQDDSDGSRIKARYKELEELLQSKYGPGRSQVHIDKEYDGNKFQIGLHNKANWMYTEFFPHDLRIELSAFEQYPRTRWRIIFEYLPGMERLPQQRKRVEDQAL